MSRQAVYEQVSSTRPGQPFKPSGLYKHVGYFQQRRFVRATTPAPLRTLAQIQASAPHAQATTPATTPQTVKAQLQEMAEAYLHRLDQTRSLRAEAAPPPKITLDEVAALHKTAYAAGRVRG